MLTLQLGCGADCSGAGMISTARTLLQFANLLHDDAFQLVCRFQLLLSHGFCLIERGKAESKVARQRNRSA
jgi:hypothetical protein